MAPPWSYGRITTCIWVSTKVHRWKHPIDIEDYSKGDCIYYRTTMVEFYPDASEDIPNDMLEPKEWK
jgi:hypothetical protein